MSKRHRKQRDQSAPDDDGLWVQSGVAADGTWIVEFNLGDAAWSLTPDQALQHVLAVFTIANQADHDAAVIKQLLHIGVELEAAGLTVSDLRADRAEVHAAAPIDLVPGVSSDGQYRPFLILTLHGERLGQWTVADAVEHAHAVLNVVATVDLDAAYNRMLTGTLNLEPGRASNVVNDLGNFRALK